MSKKPYKGMITNWAVCTCSDDSQSFSVTGTLLPVGEIHELSRRVITSNVESIIGNLLTTENSTYELGEPRLSVETVRDELFEQIRNEIAKEGL